MLAFNEISYSFKNQRDVKKFPGLEKVWEYLERRGVSRTVADACSLHVMPAVELIAAARRSANVNAVDSRAAIVFPHWRLGQEEPIEWWSSRLVELSMGGPSLVVSFGDLVGPARKPGKMFCPPNEAPHAYLPPVYDWTKLARGARVYIHESCIKAINSAVLGLPSVGLNGVWGWCSAKHGIALVPELRDLPWRALALEPVVVFDSNAHTDPHVQLAAQRLAIKLYEITGRQATALHVPIADDGTHQGFDDYRVRAGDARAREFLDGDGAVIEIGELQAMLLQLSEECCVVHEMKKVAIQETGVLMTKAEFTELIYAHFLAEIEDGDDVRRVNVPKLWLTDAARRVVVGSLEYSPGAGRLVPQPGGGLPNLNMWRGMGLEPDGACGVDPWLELLAGNIEDEDLRRWLVAWCAYPLQHLGAKVNSFPLIFGPSGVGKDLFLRPMHVIYGANAVKVSNSEMKSNFNSIYAMRQWVHVDELERSRGEGGVVNNRIKSITTDKTVTVNRKGQPEYVVDNHINLVVTSNYWDCVKLDQDDRRSCVLRWEPIAGVVDHRGDQPYWQRYVKWADNGGAAALYQYLLDLDIAWFDPDAWAPATPWKEQVKQATMDDIEIWVKDLWDNADDVLGIQGVGKCLFTSKDLCVLCHGRTEDDITRSQITRMGVALRNVGFKQAAGGAQLRKPGGGPERWWAVRRRDQAWGPEEAVEHLRAVYR